MSSESIRKIRLATVWLSGCSGCHMSFLDLDEELLGLSERVDLVFGPLVDVKVFPPEVDVVLVEGAVGNRDQLELARILRRRSRVVVALGDCAVTGNVPSLRNGLEVETLLRGVYGNDSGVSIPGMDPQEAVPGLLSTVVPLHRVISVDVFLPGCPPEAPTIGAALGALLDGKSVALSGDAVRFG